MCSYRRALPGRTRFPFRRCGCPQKIVSTKYVAAQYAKTMAAAKRINLAHQHRSVAA